jgi:hypothetical protein
MQIQPTPGEPGVAVFLRRARILSILRYAVSVPEERNCFWGIGFG